MRRGPVRPCACAARPPRKVNPQPSFPAPPSPPLPKGAGRGRRQVVRRAQLGDEGGAATLSAPPALLKGAALSRGDGIWVSRGLAAVSFYRWKTEVQGNGDLPQVSELRNVRNWNSRLADRGSVLNPSKSSHTITPPRVEWLGWWARLSLSARY